MATDERHWSRRDFLSRTAGGMALSPFVLNLAACGGGDEGTPDSPDPTPTGTSTTTGTSTAPPPPPSANALGSDEVLLGLYSQSDAATGAAAVRRALRDVDFSWLSPGDSVLVKVASNSGNAHPATTSPEAVRGMVAELLARGAGRVVVCDQSGVEWVRVTADGGTFSSTSERFGTAGILQAIQDSGAEAHFIEAQGWDGYFEATPPAGSHWTAPLMLPNIIREVDHIVYLPRLSSHALAGYTTGHKLSVGWLREDSRNHLHTAFDTFYEKYTEVNYVDDIASRFRLVVTLSERMLLHFGPDTGTVHTVDPRLVIVSQNLAHHELVAVSTFLHANSTVPSTGGGSYSHSTADGFNQFFVFNIVPTATGLPWGPASQQTYVPLVAHEFDVAASRDRSLLRAWEIRGGRPDNVRVRLDGASPTADLQSFLVSHSEGTLELA